MPTLISEFYDPVRGVLGDHNDANRLYQDTAIARAVKTVARLNLLPGYTVSVDGLNLEPTVAAPVDFARVILYTARAFISGAPGAMSFRTRGFSGSQSSRAGEQGADLNLMIHQLENGAMFNGWQSLAQWFEGFAGRNRVWGNLVRVKVQAPFETVTISDGGASVE